MKKIAINGALGRMGLTLIEAILLNKDASLGAVFEHDSHPDIGRPIQQFTPHHQGTIVLKSDVLSTVQDFEVLIDFSSIEGALNTLSLCEHHHKPIVVGTTGLNDRMTEIEKAAEHAPILFAPNMSLGVNVLLHLLREATQKLKQLDYDIEIVEAHHRHKVDAPSGTALRMGEVITQTLGHQQHQGDVFCRQGMAGAREANTIGYQTIRGGDIVGEHTAYFITDGERLELTHKASSRMTFAKGAVAAALWLANQPKGLYSIEDFLNQL